MAPSIATPRPTVGLQSSTAKSTDKCRYKTGKCLNPRSRKRNGQPHQLCRLHRDKANMIQRRFDRQKRQVARTHKECDSHGHESPTSIAMLDWSALASLTSVDPLVNSPTGHASRTSSSMSYSTLTSTDVQMYARDALPCSRTKRVWTDVSVTKISYFNEVIDLPLTLSCSQNYLSADEIDFLCAAVLE